MTIREQIAPASERSGRPSIDSSATPTPSPVPLQNRGTASEAATDSAAGAQSDDEAEGGGGSCAFPQPKLRLKIQNLDHPGAAKFLGAVNAATFLPNAVDSVLRLLYRSPSDRHTTVPPTRSVTLVLRDMDGVAYTTGVGSLSCFVCPI